MSQVINGTKLKNGNFMIELTEAQMEDLNTIYLGKSLKWMADAGKQNDLEQMELHYAIANDYFAKYEAIKSIQGK